MRPETKMHPHPPTPSIHRSTQNLERPDFVRGHAQAMSHELAQLGMIGIAGIVDQHVWRDAHVELPAGRELAHDHDHDRGT